MRQPWCVVLFTVVLQLCSCGLSGRATAGGNEAKTLQREMDPVVIAGAVCKTLAGNPIERYGLYAVRTGMLTPIPFQIDEVDASGRFVLTHGRGKGTDSDQGLFDANDELVFMAFDTGDRLLQPAVLPQAAAACAEIAVTDPLTNDKAWVYLALFPAQPPASAADYVRYDPENLKVNARNYIAQFDRRFPAAAEKYGFGKAIGGDETDMIDRVKTRIYMKLVVSLNKTEEDLAVNEIGYIDGPVRVIVRARTTMNLVLGIPATRTVGDSIYYYSYAAFPLIIDLPVRPTDFRVKVYDDFADRVGWTMYSSTNPNGHRIDGVMDDKDRGVDLSPWKWSALSDGKLAFWSLALCPPGCPVHPRLYCNDDRSAKNPPEAVPGEVPGIGWDFSAGWDKVTSFPLEIRLLHFFTKGYSPGDEDAVVSIHDHPLTTEAVPLK